MKEECLFSHTFKYFYSPKYILNVNKCFLGPLYIIWAWSHMAVRSSLSFAESTSPMYFHFSSESTQVWVCRNFLLQSAV